MTIADCESATCYVGIFSLISCPALYSRDTTKQSIYHMRSAHSEVPQMGAYKREREGERESEGEKEGETRRFFPNEHGGPARANVT